jgi:hypothetical protein
MPPSAPPTFITEEEEEVSDWIEVGEKWRGRTGTGGDEGVLRNGDVGEVSGPRRKVDHVESSEGVAGCGDDGVVGKGRVRSLEDDDASVGSVLDHVVEDTGGSAGDGHAISPLVAGDSGVAAPGGSCGGSVARGSELRVLDDQCAAGELVTLDGVECGPGARL